MTDPLLSVDTLQARMAEPSPPLAVAVFRCLAGDLVYILPPSGENLLVDCGFYKDPGIDAALRRLPGTLTQVVLTHQHLDHFASLGRVARDHGAFRIVHGGFRLPAEAPAGELSSCAAYEGLEAALWYQYDAFVEGEERWREIDLGGGLRVWNLLPDKEGLFDGELDYDALNAVSTPLGLEVFGHRILMASDTPPPLFARIADGPYARFLDRPTLFCAASHGHPEYNPGAQLARLAPRQVAITDGFPDTDFTPHFRAHLPDADIRAVNQEGPLLYLFRPDGGTERYRLELPEG